MKSTNESAKFLPLVRVEYVNPYVSALRKMGVPVERELRRARLPGLIEELSNQYVSTNLAYKCLMRCIEAEGIDDLGFEVGWGLSFDDFSSEMKQALNSAPTLKYAMETFARLSPIEDSAVESALLFEGETARIMIHQQVPPGTDRRLSDWPNIKMLIEIIRRHAGPHWLPALIGLKSRLAVCNRTRQYLGDIKVLTDQSFCYVEIPVWLLALPPIRSSFPAQGLQSARQSGNPPIQANRPGMIRSTGCEPRYTRISIPATHRLPWRPKFAAPACAVCKDDSTRCNRPTRRWSRQCASNARFTCW